MKLTRVDLRRFGRFENTVIDLPAGAGLHVLHGANEAGKTTLLNAITYSLYGMPQGASKEPVYDFQFKKAELRVGICLACDGSDTIDLVRRRGNKNTVLHPDTAPYDPQNRSYQFHQNTAPTLYGSTKAALERTSAGMAAELAPVNIAVNTLAPVEAVASVGAMKTGAIDAVAHIEPEEAMAEAALQLCSRPQAQLSGRCVLSLPLLRELGVAVHTLDGKAPLPDYSF